MNGKTITYTDGRGKQQTRQINYAINLEDFHGTAAFPWLVIFANAHLSGWEIEQFLMLKAEATPGAERSASWIQRKRWMTRKPGESRSLGVGPRPNRDGNDARAFALMQGHPKLSARQLVRLLKDRGITRGKDWVLRHRLDAPLSAN